MQKLMEAKLKRAWTEGAGARAAGQPAVPLDGVTPAVATANDSSAASNGNSVALADANMAALLELLDLEGEE